MTQRGPATVARAKRLCNSCLRIRFHNLECVASYSLFSAGAARVESKNHESVVMENGMSAENVGKQHNLLRKDASGRVRTHQMDASGRTKSESAPRCVPLHHRTTRRGYVHRERRVICAFALPNERPCNGGGIFSRTEYKECQPRHASCMMIHNYM